MHYLNTFVQHNKIDSICENLNEFMNKSNSARKVRKRFSNIEILTYEIMDNIDKSVGKVFREEKLPDKEVVRRVLRLWN